MNLKPSQFLLNLSFLLAVLALLGIFAHAGISFNALIESDELVGHTLLVQNALDETLSLLTDAEAGQRGYIITGDKDFLETYTAALDPDTGIHARLAELRELTGDNPRQQERLDRLEGLVETKLEVMRKNIELRERAGFEAAQESVADGLGMETMNAIRALVGEMDAEESALLQARSDAAAASLRSVRATFGVGVPVMLAIMVAGYYLLNRQVAVRRRAEGALQELNAELDRRVTERTAALAESERNFRVLADSALVGIYRTNLQGEVLYVNRALARSLGFDSPEELIRFGAVARYRDPADHQAFLEELQRDGAVESAELVLLKKSGEPITALVSAKIEGGQLVGTILDITDRKRAEIHIQHLTRLYAALSQVNQTIVRAKDRDDLFPSICRVAVDYGKFGLAWIGLVDRETGEVTPVAVQGASQDHLPFETINLNQAPFKDGLMGSAARSDQIAYSRDIQTDPAMQHWREMALADGYHSAAAIPFHSNGGLFGLLNLYSAEVDSFADPEQHSLLEEMAEDISFALDTMQVEAQRKRAEEEIIRLAYHNKLVLESVGEGIYGIDMNGIVTFVNPAAARFFGEPRENLIGIPGHDHHHHTRPDGTPYPREECPIYAAFHDGATHHADDEVFWRADGTSFPVEYTSTPVRNENGEIAGAVVVFKDIVERTQAEESLRASEERYRSTLDNMLEGCQIIGFDWRYIYINAEAEKHNNRPSAELMGGRYMDMWPGIEETHVFAVIERCMEERVPHHLENEFTFPDGAVGWFELHIQPIPEGVLILSADITDLKRTQENRLAREVAERASQAKSEFLSRMSHEFRTPLNAILGFAQLLKMDELAPAQERGVDQIYKSGKHLLDLVNEVLDIARIESGRMTISPEAVRVMDAVNEVFDLIRPMAEARRLSLTLKIPSSTDVFVEADRQRFKQVLLNLLSNAVKYNREGGAIEVIASLTIGGYLRLQVRDTGAGVPPEKMERLFVPFDRLDTDFSEGTGLGLALSKGLIETMGGRIGVESKVGEGSAFWIELKLVTERLKEVIMAEVDENITQSARNGKGVVLYVEDNLANITLVEAIMERMPSVKLVTAMQGRLAMSLAKEHKPDLILLDLHLPDIHGSDVLRHLKAEPATRAIPVVIISADAMPSHVNELLAQGAKGYLTKPIDVKEFLKTVEEHI